MFKLKEY